MRNSDDRLVLYTMESFVILYPKSEEHYSCEVHHNGLIKPLRASIKINILNEPGFPIVEGIKQGDSVIAGQLVNLTCISRGGYPPPMVNWFKNGNQLTSKYTVNSRNDVINFYSFIASKDDNQSVLKCSVINSLIQQPLEVSIKLNVLCKYFFFIFSSLFYSKNYFSLFFLLKKIINKHLQRHLLLAP